MLEVKTTMSALKVTIETSPIVTMSGFKMFFQISRTGLRWQDWSTLAGMNVQQELPTEHLSCHVCEAQQQDLQCQR
eukprot:4232312-Karenia_brevis.AAC.1